GGCGVVVLVVRWLEWQRGEAATKVALLLVVVDKVVTPVKVDVSGVAGCRRAATVRAKVTEIEKSKDLTSLSPDELIGNLKVYELIIKKEYEIVKDKGERKSLALKAKKEPSDEECSTFKSEDEEYAMAVRDFKKFFEIRECPKPPKDKNQIAFIRGSWSDSGEEDKEKTKDETRLVAQASNE
nr:alpha/beta hydrolases superfamily protein [Tanacetum cinerariifolium]